MSIKHGAFAPDMAPPSPRPALPVQVKRVREGAILPEYKTDMAAGFDLHACVDEWTELQPGETVMVPTGLAFFIGNPSYVGKVYVRSSAGKAGFALANGTGIIDADYQGELVMMLTNRTRGTVLDIRRGDRLAQLVLTPVIHAAFEEVEEFAVATRRGEGAFGSTGVR
jgi:dUTP pyrophosphatase